MAVEITNQCPYFNISRMQRSEERKRGEGIDGTLGYDNMGCYICDGYNTDCKSYINPREIYDEAYRRRNK